MAVCLCPGASRAGATSSITTEQPGLGGPSVQPAGAGRWLLLSLGTDFCLRKDSLAYLDQRPFAFGGLSGGVKDRVVLESPGLEK